VETHALSNIHLEVRGNEWVSIVGPSGSGKTTLLAILGLLDTATSGQYVLDASRGSTCRLPTGRTSANRHIGFIFQKLQLSVT